MSNVRTSLINGIRNNLRSVVQVLFFIYIVGIGARFLHFYLNVKAGNLDVTRPLGVEGFLPISALLGLKQLIVAHKFDTIHGAGLTIFILAIVMSFIFKKSFCSHVCPVGLVSEAFSKLGKEWKIPFYIPVWTLKYIPLVFFTYVVFLNMNTRSISAFLQSPYNMISDAKMLELFFPPSPTTIIVLAVIAILTLLFSNFWCKYLCPYGALLGLVSVLSPIKVRRNVEACTSCLQCTKACPSKINVHLKKTVHTPECMGCHECINARLHDDCLTTTTVKYKRWFPVAIALVFLVGVALSMIFGYWRSDVENQMYMIFINQNLSHY